MNRMPAGVKARSKAHEKSCLQRSIVYLAGAAILACQAAGNPALAESAILGNSLHAAPQNYHLLYDEQTIRIVAEDLAAHSREPTHADPYWAVVIATRAPINAADGPGATVPERTDTITSPLWLAIAKPGSVHSPKNSSNIPERLIRVEFKTGAIPILTHPSDALPTSSDGTDPAGWDAKLDGPIAAPHIHTVLFEDQDIIVEKVSTPAGDSEPYHSHRYFSVMIDYSDLPAPPQVRLYPPIAPHTGRNSTARATQIILVDFKHGFN